MTKKSFIITDYFKRSTLNDFSTWLLIFSNLLVIAFAVIENWDLLTLMWIYWFQSVIIGFFNFIRILTLKDFSTKDFHINNKPVKATKGVKIFTAFFFAFHYGGFHLVYLGFLFIASFTSIIPSSITSYPAGPSDIAANVSDIVTNVIYILVSTAIFFINHLYSFLHNRKKDKKKQNIGRVMFFPYARIIPMHLTIVVGIPFLGGGLIQTTLVLFLFLILKTIADVVMHTIEHADLDKR